MLPILRIEASEIGCVAISFRIVMEHVGEFALSHDELPNVVSLFFRARHRVGWICTLMSGRIRRCGSVLL